MTKPKIQNKVIDSKSRTPYLHSQPSIQKSQRIRDSSTVKPMVTAMSHPMVNYQTVLTDQLNQKQSALNQCPLRKQLPISVESKQLAHKTPCSLIYQQKIAQKQQTNITPQVRKEKF